MARSNRANSTGGGALAHGGRGGQCGKGFTLIELLVVVAIIAILLAVAGNMLGRGNTGDPTRAAARELRAMVELAEARALASGNQTAVLIANKSTSDRFLRFAMVVERSETSTSTPASPQYEWRPVGNGSYFPKGAYYYVVPGKSHADVFGGTEPMIFGEAFSTGDDAMARTDWIALNFNSQGIPVSNGLFTTNPKMLVTGGFIEDGSHKVSDKEKLLTEGFMLQRSNGRIVPIENPTEQLGL